MLQGHVGTGLGMLNCTQTQFAYILPNKFTEHQFQNLQKWWKTVECVCVCDVYICVCV